MKKNIEEQDFEEEDSEELDIQEDLEKVQQKFDNLKKVNLLNLYLQSFSKLCKILATFKINHISFKKHSQNPFDFKIRSKTGNILFYDCKEKHMFNIEKLEIYFTINDYIKFDEFVIIFYQNMPSFSFDFNNATKTCKDYDSLELDKFEQPIFVIHKKHIHQLTIIGGLNQKLQISPSKKLELVFPMNYSEHLLNYLNSNLINKVYTKIK